MTDLERDALNALRAVIRGTTRPMGEDSTGAAYCHIREASMAAARIALHRLEVAHARACMTHQEAVTVASEGRRFGRAATEAEREAAALLVAAAGEA